MNEAVRRSNKQPAKTEEPKKKTIKLEMLSLGEFELTIVEGVPLPPGKRQGGMVLPFLAELAVGSYVEIKDKKAYQKLYTAAGAYGHKSGKVFAGRTLGASLFGIWRIK